MKRLAHGFGRALVGTATFLLLGALIAFAVGTYLLYWPVSKASPRFSKMRQIATVLAELQVLWMLAQREAPPAEAEPEPEVPVPFG